MILGEVNGGDMTLVFQSNSDDRPPCSNWPPPSRQAKRSAPAYPRGRQGHTTGRGALTASQRLRSKAGAVRGLRHSETRDIGKDISRACRIRQKRRRAIEQLGGFGPRHCWNSKRSASRDRGLEARPISAHATQAARRDAAAPSLLHKFNQKLRSARSDERFQSALSALSISAFNPLLIGP